MNESKMAATGADLATLNLVEFFERRFAPAAGEFLSRHHGRSANGRYLRQVRSAIGWLERALGRPALLGDLQKSNARRAVQLASPTAMGRRRIYLKLCILAHYAEHDTGGAFAYPFYGRNCLGGSFPVANELRRLLAERKVRHGH